MIDAIRRAKHNTNMKLLSLPNEIKYEIYEYALGKHRIRYNWLDGHRFRILDNSNLPTPFKARHIVHFHSTGTQYEISTASIDTSIRLAFGVHSALRPIQACRQTYHESFTTLIETNTFFIKTAIELKMLLGHRSLLMKELFQTIRHLDIDLGCNVKFDPHDLEAFGKLDSLVLRFTLIPELIAQTHPVDRKAMSKCLDDDRSNLKESSEHTDQLQSIGRKLHNFCRLPIPSIRVMALYHDKAEMEPQELIVFDTFLEVLVDSLLDKSSSYRVIYPVKGENASPVITLKRIEQEKGEDLPFEKYSGRLFSSNPRA